LGTRPAHRILPVEFFRDIKPDLEQQWLIDGILPYAGDAVIFGLPRGGKTFIALDMALHVAAGLVWMGREVTGGGVIYLAAEGAPGLRRRIAAWKRDRNIDDALFALVPVALNLLKGDDIHTLKEKIDSVLLEREWPGIRLLVIDTLSKTFGGGDENGADMAAYMSNISRAFETYDCLRLLVHHQPWGPDVKRPRGHSSLLGAVDAAIHVSSDDSSQNRELLVTKQKDGEDGQIIGFKLRSVDIGTNSKGTMVSSCVVDGVDPAVVFPTKRGRRLATSERIALLQLDEITESRGFLPPDEIPEEAINRRRTGKAVRFTDWQAATLSALTDPDKKPDSIRRSFQRIRKSLQATGNIGIWEDFVWRNWR